MCIVLVQGSGYCSLQIKAMIPEMKGSVLLPELMPELDNPSPEPQNHRDASQTKTADAEEEEEVMEAASGSLPEDSAVKRQVSYKSQESTKQKGQDSVKLSRTIFQVSFLFFIHVVKSWVMK